MNLRKEEYDDSSRIPSISIGTPLEDAYRRDLTINSLFYNVNTGTVEDFTMRGVSDLHDRLVRTPLPAIETFREDPLRLLRAVRFEDGSIPSFRSRSSRAFENGDSE